jgi:hypothetical protein
MRNNLFQSFETLEKLSKKINQTLHFENSNFECNLFTVLNDIKPEVNQ